MKGHTAFYKGEIVEPWILDRIRDAAQRGLITEAGRKLILVPDTRFGSADSYGRREFANGQMIGRGSRAKKSKRLRQSDCIPLTALLPK